MKFYKTISFNKLSMLFLLVWIATASCVTTKTSNDAFYFIQMTDPQFGFYTDNKSFEKETALYTRAIQEANRLRPAFVIVTGDLVNLPFDSAQIAEYKRISNQLDARIPLYNLAGNHDVGNTPAPQDIAAYKKDFGSDYYTFTHQSMLGIVLNSLYLHSPQKVPQQAQEQEAWLKKTLEDAKEKNYRHVIVFLHHPLYLKKEDEADQYFNIPMATRKKYLDLFKASGIRYVFAGHYHRNDLGKGGPIEMVTTGPVGKPLGKDPSGFRIITVKGNEVSHQYYNLDSIPARINF